MPVLGVPKAMAYLNSRGIDPAFWDFFDLRYDATKDTVCFPIRTSTGKLAGMRGRFLKPVADFRHFDYKWNHINNTALVWLGEHHIDFLKPVVVVEGQFDYAKVFQVYHNVLSNLTSSLSVPKIKKLQNAVEVISFFDNDAAGGIAHELLQHKLGPLRRVVYPKGSKDPGAMTVNQLIESLGQLVMLDNLKPGV